MNAAERTITFLSVLVLLQVRTSRKKPSVCNAVVPSQHLKMSGEIHSRNLTSKHLCGRRPLRSASGSLAIEILRSWDASPSSLSPKANTALSIGSDPGRLMPSLYFSAALPSVEPHPGCNGLSLSNEGVLVNSCISAVQHEAHP